MSWNEGNNTLEKTFKFDSFMQAMDFMTECSKEIDAQNHHPEWSNIYNKVTVCLTTHDEGNTITAKDRKLAAVIDQVYCNYP